MDFRNSECGNPPAFTVNDAQYWPKNLVTLNQKPLSAWTKPRGPFAEPRTPLPSKYNSAQSPHRLAQNPNQSHLSAKKLKLNSPFKKTAYYNLIKVILFIYLNILIQRYSTLKASVLTIIFKGLSCTRPSPHMVTKVHNARQEAKVTNGLTLQNNLPNKTWKTITKSAKKPKKN